MVMAALRKSLQSPTWGKHKVPDAYPLGTGHVRFFYNKHEFMEQRWQRLIRELERRGYQIDPSSRRVHFRDYRKVVCVAWKPRRPDIQRNLNRIWARYMEKPGWYKYYGKPITPRRYNRLLERFNL